MTFVGAEIDRLEVAVEAEAAKANRELDKLIRRLEKISSSLEGVNGKGLTGFARGLDKLEKSMQKINSVKDKNIDEEEHKDT